MDSSSTTLHSWLGFSLSNHQPSSENHTTSSSQLCLFEAFNPTTTHSPTDTIERDHGTAGAGAGASAPVDLSMFSAGPKLEDFLGGGGGGARAVALPLMGQFHESEGASTGIYDSDLKTIAASFLRGYSSSSSIAEQMVVNSNNNNSSSNELEKVGINLPVDSSAKKSADTFGQRTSIYRGVTRHRWTGRYEAHLWDNSCRREGQSRKGRQVYLGGYDKEEKAARAYDLAALKYWGPTTTTNFPVSEYEKELEEMKNMSRQEFVASLRRKSSGFSRGASIYRGVTRHHQHGRWQARIGRVAGNKDLYLGTFSTEEEAAEAYDIAAIKFRGLNAVTNFDMSRYDVKSIASSNLPIGGINSKNSSTKSSIDSINSENKSLERSRSDELLVDHHHQMPLMTPSSSSSSSTLSFAIPIKQGPSPLSSDCWGGLLGGGGGLMQFQSNYDHKKTSSSTNSRTLFQTLTNGNIGSAFHSLSSSNLTMDFSSDLISHHHDHQGNNNNNNRYFNGGVEVHHHQQQGINGTNSSIHFGAPITVSTSNGYESPSYGNWVSSSSSVHSHLPAKPNISVFQTPIYGME